MARLSLARAADAARRGEVERHLAARGWSGVRRSPPPAGAPLDAESARDLARTLSRLGPVFTAFARYLSWRADLFAPAACLELAETPDDTAAPAAAVTSRLVEEVGAGPAELFATFEATPVSSGPLWQVHHATLPGRRPILVRLRRPGLEQEMERDLPLLPLLQAGWNGSREDLAAAIADFGTALEAEIDAGSQAEALAALATPATVPLGEPPPAARGLLTAPAIERPFSTAAVLTTSVLAGRRLAAGHRFPGTTSAREAHGRAAWGTDRYGPTYDLAPRLALAWLELAFAGERFPLEADLLLLDDGRIAVEAGTFGRLTSASQGPLWDYVCATADHDPERAADCLLSELEPGPQADADAFKKRLRQLAPLADRQLSAGRDALARHLLAHWQLAHRYGFTARPALADFYRGVFWLARVMAPLAPAAEAGLEVDDPLVTALEDLRWQATWSEWRRLGREPRAMVRVMESYARALAALPRQLEAALDGVERRRHAPSTAPARRERRQNATAGAGALGMLMAAVALVAGRLAAAMPAGRRWIEVIATLLFAGLGALLLGLAGGAARKRKDN